MDDNNIKYVLVMPNGMVAVYNYLEQQMPELQGYWKDHKKEIYLQASKQDKEIFWSVANSPIDYGNKNWTG